MSEVSMDGRHDLIQLEEERRTRDIEARRSGAGDEEVVRS